jgi:hypothetical protein
MTDSPNVLSGGIPAALFPLGDLVVTQGARDEISEIETRIALDRHARGDWGLLDDEDRASNARALQEGSRLVSRHQSRDGTTFYVITEHDRSATTVLLPKEY